MQAHRVVLKLVHRIILVQFSAEMRWSNNQPHRVEWPGMLLSRRTLQDIKLGWRLTNKWLQMALANSRWLTLIPMQREQPKTMGKGPYRRVLQAIHQRRTLEAMPAAHRNHRVVHQLQRDGT